MYRLRRGRVFRTRPHRASTGSQNPRRRSVVEQDEVAWPSVTCEAAERLRRVAEPTPPSIPSVPGATLCVAGGRSTEPLNAVHQFAPSMHFRRRNPWGSAALSPMCQRSHPCDLPGRGIRVTRQSEVQGAGRVGNESGPQNSLSETGGHAAAAENLQRGRASHSRPWYPTPPPGRRAHAGGPSRLVKGSAGAT